MFASLTSSARMDSSLYNWSRCRRFATGCLGTARRKWSKNQREHFLFVQPMKSSRSGHLRMMFSISASTTSEVGLSLCSLHITANLWNSINVISGRDPGDFRCMPFWPQNYKRISLVTENFTPHTFLTICDVKACIMKPFWHYTLSRFVVMKCSDITNNHHCVIVLVRNFAQHLDLKLHSITYIAHRQRPMQDIILSFRCCSCINDDVSLTVHYVFLWIRTWCSSYIGF